MPEDSGQCATQADTLTTGIRWGALGLAPFRRSWTVAKKLREVLESGLCANHQEQPPWTKRCELCDLVKEAQEIADRALAK